MSFRTFVLFTSFIDVANVKLVTRVSQGITANLTTPLALEEIKSYVQIMESVAEEDASAILCGKMLTVAVLLIKLVV